MHASAEPLPSASSSTSHLPDSDPILNELTELKRQLLQAEVRLARARATVAGSEADVKVLSARLRAFTK
jgi:hypothetical protein